MKKIIMLLLTLTLTFGFTACGGNGESGGVTPEADYDDEYTIVIGGSDEWTPFEGEGGVTFENSKANVIGITDDEKTVTFTGLDVGEAEITAISGSNVAKVLVKVIKREEEKKVNVEFRSAEGTYGQDGETVQIYLWLEPKTGERNFGLMPDQVVITPEGALGDFIVQYVDYPEFTHVIALGLTPTVEETITISFDKKGYEFSPSSMEVTIYPPGA